MRKLIERVEGCTDEGVKYTFKPGGPKSRRVKETEKAIDVMYPVIRSYQEVLNRDDFLELLDTWEDFLKLMIKAKKAAGE